MNRYEYRKSRDDAPIVGKNSAVGAYGKISNVLTTVSRLCRVTLCTITVVTAVAASADGWRVSGAQAAPAARPPLTLNLEGPNDAQAGQPLDGIVVRLINPGQSAPASRLRLFIHDLEDRMLGADDIKIEVREGNAWSELPVEAIDGGVMVAIGEKGKPHNETHKRGGFTIDKKENKVWRLRMLIRMPGHYSLVVAVSPDNGETQLAQPVGMNMEVL